MLDFAIPQVIAVLSPRTMAEDIAAARKCVPDIIEYRADLQDSTDAETIVGHLTLIRKKLGLPILFTLRDKREGGEYGGTHARRVHLCTVAAPLVDAVDIEIINARDLGSVPREIGDHTISAILSFHNLTATPGDEELDRLVTEGAVGGADAVKIAVSCVTRTDALRLLSLPARNSTVPMIVAGMGAFGGVVRMVAPMFGSALGYASLSAPVVAGQLPVADLRRAWAMLGIGV